MGRPLLGRSVLLLAVASARFSAAAPECLAGDETSLLQTAQLPALRPASPTARRVAGGASTRAVLGPAVALVYNGTTHRSRAQHVWQHNMLDPARGSVKDLHPADYMDGDEGMNFLHAASFKQWGVLAASCVVSMLVDIFLLRKMKPCFQTHMQLIAIWLSVAALFNGWIAVSISGEAAIEWTSGYFLEWMLSLDNLFVFHLIFKKYKTPPAQIRYAVAIGIAGAVVLRMLFFMVLSTLLHMFIWMRIPFGALLVWSGIQTAMEDGDEEEDPQDLFVVRAVRACLGGRLLDQYGETPAIFQTNASGKTQATLLLIVVVSLEMTDLLFAVDNVSAKVAQIPNQYVAFSSSVIAMFGLRAMFFVVEDLVNMFHLLQYGLCVILCFIGFQLIFSEYMHMPASVVCLLIMAIFSVCIAGSWATASEKDGEEAPAGKAEPKMVK